MTEKYLHAILILLSLISLQLNEKSESPIFRLFVNVVATAFLISGILAFFFS